MIAPGASLAALWHASRDRFDAWRRTSLATMSFSTLEAAPALRLDDMMVEHAPHGLRRTHQVAAALFLTLALASCFVELDTVVVASGRLVTDQPMIVLQPMALSVIRDIAVKPGDEVRRGDVVARLDPTFARADEAAQAGQLATLDAQIARLEAELEGRAPVFATEGPIPDLQRALFTQRQTQLEGRLRSLDTEIERIHAALLGAQRNLASLEKQLDIAREVEAVRDKLYKMQVGSRLNALDAQVNRMRGDRDVEDTRTRVIDLTQSLAGKKAERQVFLDDWRRQILEELSKARTEQANVTEGLNKAKRLGELVSLTAPADAIVLDVAKRSIGSVVQAAEPVVTLVSTESDLVAEIMIPASDVGYTTIGDDVTLKVDAFPWQKHGAMTGFLRAIGRDSLSPSGAGSSLPSGGQPIYHRAQVVLTHERLENLPNGAHVMPGMTLSAEIKVGKRRLVSYFIEPITRGLRESLREP